MKRTPILVLHYNEIWLKGCNRPFFVSRLRESVARALEGLAVSRPRHSERRLLVEAEDRETAERAVERLTRVPGVQFVGVGFRTAPTLDEMVETAAELMRERRVEGGFRVRAKRSDKALPYSSGDIERAAGARILADARADGRSLRVDLKGARATCWVEATPEGAYLFTDKVPGVGGLPTNTAGRLMCLLSGGIDSAVAAYKMIRRGARIVFVHFHAPPARPGEDSPPIAREIVRRLTLYQGESRLYLVPFQSVQRSIVARAPEEFRLLLYRRMMLRIAERLARGGRCRGTVTGDSVAQVASQTLPNLAAVGAVAELPLYRPLCGDDKAEIVELARRIGTFDISTEPFTDCCPLYLPRNPRVYSNIEELNEAEAGLDIESLVEMALDDATREIYEYRGGEVRGKSVKPYVSSRARTEVAAV